MQVRHEAARRCDHYVRPAAPATAAAVVADCAVVAARHQRRRLDGLLVCKQRTRIGCRRWSSFVLHSRGAAGARRRGESGRGSCTLMHLMDKFAICLW